MVVITAEPISPIAQDEVPERVGIAPDGQTMNLTFAGGESRSLKSSRLRMACRCAQCVRARVDGVAAPGNEDVAIVAVDPMGHYGISIAFSDGHARGIYPWSYLTELLKE